MPLHPEKKVRRLEVQGLRTASARLEGHRRTRVRPALGPRTPHPCWRHETDRYELAPPETAGTYGASEESTSRISSP